MFGILPFLVQWIALSSIGNQLSRLRHPEKSYWTLLSDFKNLPENEIEKFLPQVCSILVERDVTQDSDIFAYLEKILADKCAGCVTFGFRACSLLKAASQGPSEGIFRNVLSGGSSNNAQTLREERIRYLSDLMESATMQGSHQLPPRVEYLRGIYFRDVVFVLDSLARLGIELKSYPVVQRNTNLRNAISQLNALLFNRMLSKGQYGLQQLSNHLATGISSAGGGNSGDNFANTYDTNSMHTSPSLSSSSSQDVRNAHQIAQNCPEAADYSIHLPLQHCEEKVLRILRFVPHECEVLPSKDRCPYVLVCEVLERPYTCKNDRLYAQPAVIQPAIQRPPPQQLLANISQQHQQQSPSSHHVNPQLSEAHPILPINVHTDNNTYIDPITTTATTGTSTSTIHPLHAHAHIPAHYSPPPSFVHDIPQPTYPHQPELGGGEEESVANGDDRSNSNNHHHHHHHENLNLFARHDVTSSSSSSSPASTSAVGSANASNKNDLHSNDVEESPVTADTNTSSNSIINSDDRIDTITASLDERESLKNIKNNDNMNTTIDNRVDHRVNKSKRTLFKRRYSSSSSSPTEVRGGFDSSIDDDNDSSGGGGYYDMNDGSVNYSGSQNNDDNNNDDDDDPLYSEYLRLQSPSSSSSSSSLPPGTIHHPSAALPTHIPHPAPHHPSPYPQNAVIEPVTEASSSSSFRDAAVLNDPYSHHHHQQQQHPHHHPAGNNNIDNNNGNPSLPSNIYQQQPHEPSSSSLHQSAQSADYATTMDRLQQQPAMGVDYHHPPAAYPPSPSSSSSSSMQTAFSNAASSVSSPEVSAMSYTSYTDTLQSPPSSSSSSLSKCTFLRGKTFEEKKELVRATSVFGHLPGWNLKSFIVKSGDDLRKEMLAMQLIEYCQSVFHHEGLDILLRPYQIISTGSQTGLVEFLEGTKSIDRIKKSYINIDDPNSSSSSSSPTSSSNTRLPTLKDYFEFTFGPSYTFVHSQAVSNFVRSLVGYSLVTYVLQVKDRHNANILVSADGTVIHIDFGFILGESPGFNINFENAPFKLTREYINVLGGIDSQAFKTFEELFIKGFIALQKHIDGMYAIVQAYYGERRKGVADALRSRVLFANSHADIVGLIRDSLDSWRTKQYDWYQQKANNIVM